MLGHANLSQHLTYLNATRLGLRESVRRSEQSGIGCNPVANEGATDRSGDGNEAAVASAHLVVN